MSSDPWPLPGQGRGCGKSSERSGLLNLEMITSNGYFNFCDEGDDCITQIFEYIYVCVCMTVCSFV